MVDVATTSLWKVENRLDKVIKYTTNPEKTENKNWYKDLHNAIEYTKADFKTEKQLYVTGINCSEDNTLRDMIYTKKRYGKTKGVLAYHRFQSFAEGEVTAKTAHEIGVKLAEELWGDKYEVIVSTHLNTNHLHNHFLLNSVSFVDGRKYRNTRENYALMRKTSDDICKEYGLSVLEEKPCGRHKIDYTKYYTSYIQKSDYYTNAKEDIDYAISQAYSYKNFEKILEDMGYTITIRANKISVCRPPYKRNIRIERNFGEEYSISNIEDRILNSQVPRVPFPEARSKVKRYYSKNKYNLNKERGSLYRLYLYYCYLLKKFPNNRNKVKISQDMRKDIKKMDTISNEIKFLCRNNIKSTEELFLYKKQTIDKMNDQMHTRTILRRKRQKTTDAEERQKLCDEILQLSNSIFALKKEVGYCQDIEERKQKIKENMEYMQEKEKENQKGKEKNNELIRFS